MSDRAAGILSIVTVAVFFLLAKVISEFIDNHRRE